MATFDDVLKGMGEVLKGLTRDVGELKSQVNRLRTLESGGWYVPFTNYSSLAASLTASTGVFIATIPRQIVVRSWKQTWLCQAPGDATTNFWTVRLFYGGNLITQFTTQAGPLNTWNRTDALAMGVTVSEANRYLYVDAIKTGAPGALFLAAPAVYVF
jgi:hypothetical protein